jgi:hypothetical protein
MSVSPLQQSTLRIVGSSMSVTSNGGVPTWPPPKWRTPQSRSSGPDGLSSLPQTPLGARLAKRSSVGGTAPQAQAAGGAESVRLRVPSFRISLPPNAAQ